MATPGILKIYKVRYLDVFGHEVAEFGYYESRKDAMQRWNEISGKINMPGSMDIREISVVRDSEMISGMYGQNADELPHYELKEK